MSSPSQRLEQLPTDQGVELGPGTYLFTFPAYQIAAAIQAKPDWPQRAAEAVAADDDRVKATFQEGGFVNLPGQPNGAFYQIKVKLEPADGVGTESLVAFAIGAVVVAVLAAVAIQYLQIIKIEKLTELADTPAAQDAAKGLKWLGVAGAVVAVAVLVSVLT